MRFGHYYGMRVNIFNEEFSDTSTLTSDEVIIPKGLQTVTVFVAPDGVDTAIFVEVSDPQGEWHACGDELETDDANCDALVVPFNPRQMRVKVTPSAGTGTAIIWIVAN